MRVVIQRVSSASLSIEGIQKCAINRGLLVLLGIEHEDTEQDIEWLVGKIRRLRIFADGDGNMNLALDDIKGEIMVVSQFTLHSSTRKGNRPSFIAAARPETAIPLYEKFLRAISPCQCGTFGADMQISLVNDGPVTIIIDSKIKE